MNLPGFAFRHRLHLWRIRSGSTFVRVSKVTRGLLAQIEAKHDEPLDALVFYMTLTELGVDPVTLTGTLDANPRLGCARDIRKVVGR